MPHIADQTKLLSKKAESSEDEIELIDIFLFFWKWKFLIIGGTAFCATAAIVVSLVVPKIYKIETVFRPGILNIGDKGEFIFIDTPENIKALIETGIIDASILRSLGEHGENSIPKMLKFNITLPSNSSTIKVSYESSDINQGIKILDLLGQSLMDEYRNLVMYYRNEIQREINIKKADLQNISNIKQSYESNVKSIEKRIHDLETEIVTINENTASLNKERKDLLSKKKDENNILSVILYSNTIQQNLDLSNDYKDEINTYKLKREDELQKISMLENKRQILLAEIDNFEFKKNNIQNIQVIRKPTNSPYPIKPNMKINVILAALISLFSLVILSFIIEYTLKNRDRKISTQH
jgi:capsular polysaccharide biosynthesis protein